MNHWLFKVLTLGLLLLLTLGVEAKDLPGDSTRKMNLNDSTSRIQPMGLFDLNAGANFRSAHMSNDISPGNSFINQASGFSGRMQSSIRWSYRAIRPRKFMWGDILSGEVYIGKLSSSMPHQSGDVWVAYKFELGIGGRLTISKNSDVGLNLILLKFARDNVSGNFSGSGITGRYRYKRAMIEAGAEARQDRALGVLIDIQKKDPLQLTFTGRWLLKGRRNIGVNLETLPAMFSENGVDYSKTWSLRIFYGIYF
jgi:hypothetical protein